jgi:hypothetical protein
VIHAAGASGCRISGLGYNDQGKKSKGFFMDGIVRLIAIEDIKQLKDRYLRALVMKDWKLLRSVFADDATLDYRGEATDPSAGINAVPGPRLRSLPHRLLGCAERNWRELTARYGLRGQLFATRNDTVSIRRGQITA